MSNELLSVIVPIYNVEKDLAECVKSIMNQTYRNMEIILVDDGSIDNSGKICDDYAKTDERVKVIHQNNKGLINARYTGLSEASAEYVTFVDGDDFIDENMYADLMKLTILHNTDMITCGCYRYREMDDYSTDICSRVDEGYYTYADMEEKIFPVMFWEETTNVWAVDPSLCMKIFKKNILLSQYEKLKNHQFFYGEDSAITYPAILEMNSMYITHNCYYYHRQSKRGTVKQFLVKDNFLAGVWELYNYLHDEFQKSEYREILFRQLDFFYMKSVGILARKYPEVKIGAGMASQWLFPFGKVQFGSRVVLYGAGAVGKQYWQQLQKTEYCAEIVWVDKNAQLLNDKNILTPEYAAPDKYDVLVIAIKDVGLANRIAEGMISKGWSKEQIVIPKFD